MTSITTKPKLSQPRSEGAVQLFDNWFDPIETEVRGRARDFIEELIRGELDAALARPRYGRGPMTGDEESAAVSGYRHGSRTRSLLGTFGRVEIEVPRARLNSPDGKTTEWKSSALRAYQRRTLAADALIAGTYLAGTNTRRVRRALAAPVREDGQKVLLAIKSMGAESAEAWRAVLDDLIKRGLRRPEFLIVDGAPGLDKAIAAV
jgi:putative transposase